MKTSNSTLLIFILCFTNCTIEEEFSLSESIVGKWAFSGRTAFFKDGSSSSDLPLDFCELELEFILYEDGKLFYEDFNEIENTNGLGDLCELNLLTSENGTWKVSSDEKLSFILKNTENDADIFINAFAIEVPNIDQLNIRYSEFENVEDENILYYIYHYFRIYGEF